MGCFGDMEDTKKVTSTTKQVTSPPEWVESAGRSNYDLARSMLERGFQPYMGELTAPLSDNERAASELIAATAGSGNPYAGTAADNFTRYGNAPGAKFDFSTVIDPNGPLGSVESYMDPYLAQVLAPALRQIGFSGAQQRQDINANATAAGAYGDARHGVVEGEQRRNQMQQETDTTAQGYSGAFNTAMGLRMQDLQRLFGTQQAQAAADESALARARQSAIDLTGLDQYGVSRALSLASALGQTGANERNVRQQADSAAFQEFMRKNNFTNDQIAFLTSILAGTPTSRTTTGSSEQVTAQPDNSGWGAIGTIASSLLSRI